MQGWHGTYLGLREIPRELSEFELQAFFTFSSTERAWVQRRRGPALRLGLALHIGFVRMSGRPLDAFRVLPVALLRHLGRELDIPVPDVASLRAWYRRRSTLFEHQQLACRALGFRGMTEHQRRALVCVLKDECSAPPIASGFSPTHAAGSTSTRCSSAARGDMLYDAGVQLGKLLRTAFLTDYFINEGFRRELRRVLNQARLSTRSNAPSTLDASIRCRHVAPMTCKRSPTR